MATPPNLPELEAWEKGWPLRSGWPWWLHLLVFGHSAPIPDDEVREMKGTWQDGGTTDAERQSLLSDIRARFDERQTSTLDTFVKLTIIGALIVVVPQTAHEVLGTLGGRGTWLVWISLLSTFGAVVCMLLMITSKLKVWRRRNTSRISVGLELIRRRATKGWAEYLRLSRKLRHRQQLIKLERRLLGLASTLIVLKYAAWLLALAGV